jgi:Cthe_2314-like HEPN
MSRGSMPTRHSADWVYTRTLTRLLDLTPAEDAVFEAALSDDFPDSPEGLRAIVHGIVERVGTRPWPSPEPLLDEFCLECDAMHEQFDFLLYEMDLAVQVLHETRLEDRRLALLYHADNFCLRLYTYREKVYQLVNQALRVGVDIRDRDLRRSIREWGQSENPRVIQLLDGLERDPRIHRMIRERNAIVHQIARRRGDSLSTRQQAEDHIRVVGAADEVDRVTRIETHHRQLAGTGLRTQQHRLRARPAERSARSRSCASDDLRSVVDSEHRG